MFTDGHWTVDMQVMMELAMLLALTIHVTGSLSVACVLPSFSIVSEILPHTFLAEQLYITLSPACGEVSSTVQFGVVATVKQALLK